MSNPIMNIGVIGLGAIAKFHIPGLLEIPHLAKIKAVCDANPDALEQYNNSSWLILWLMSVAWKPKWPLW